MKIIKGVEHYSIIDALLEAVDELDSLVHFRARKFDVKFMRENLESKESYEVEFATKILPILEKDKALNFPLDFLFEDEHLVYKDTNLDDSADFAQAAWNADVPFMVISTPAELTKAKKWLEKTAKRPKDYHYFAYEM